MYNESIHIAIAIHDATGGYTRHAGVALASVLANTSRPVCAHILHDETLIPKNRLNLEQLAVSFRQQVCFYPVRLPESLAMTDCGHVTRGSLYRLMLADLPLNKVIYIDCDVVVEMDLAELWLVKLEGMAVAAVRDQGIAFWSKSVRQKVTNAGLKLPGYFNAGVMVVDLDRVREEPDLLSGLVGFLQLCPNSKFLDQDFLNRKYQTRCLWLPERFNRLVCCLPRDSSFFGRTPSLWHFSGAKPWQQIECEWDFLYWRYLLLTPWRQEATQALELMNRERQRIVSSSCWRVTGPYRAVGDFVRKIKKF